MHISECIEKNHCICKQKYIIQLTSKIENSKDLPQICDGEKVPIAHCGGSDDQEPDVISKPEGSFFASIFIVVEWVALVLKKEKKPSGPTYKAKNVGKKLKYFILFQIESENLSKFAGLVYLTVWYIVASYARSFSPNTKQSL